MISTLLIARMHHVGPRDGRVYTASHVLTFRVLTFNVAPLRVWLSAVSVVSLKFLMSLHTHCDCGHDINTGEWQVQ